MTSGSIPKQMVFFALPILLGNLFQQLYNTVDSLIVGNFLGSQALAAVSSSGNIIFLMIGFFNGVAIGAGVVISRYFGARNRTYAEGNSYNGSVWVDCKFFYDTYRHFFYAYITSLDVNARKCYGCFCNVF